MISLGIAMVRVKGGVVLSAKGIFKDPFIDIHVRRKNSDDKIASAAIFLDSIVIQNI